MIDISDGLSSDLGHICRQSGVGALLEGPAIPLGAGASLDDALAGGDDYELCFTAPDPARVAEVFLAAGLGAPARIGTVTPDGEIAVKEDGGALRPVPPSGWEHPVP
jgi:thiamine-monophosphate kinase